MSSQPPDKPPTKWPRWRVSMLVGALILLAIAVADAAIDDLPGGVRVAVFFTGYVFLSYGFFLAMGARREGGTTKKER